MAMNAINFLDKAYQVKIANVYQLLPTRTLSDVTSKRVYLMRKNYLGYLTLIVLKTTSILKKRVYLRRFFLPSTNFGAVLRRKKFGIPSTVKIYQGKKLPAVQID